MSLFETLTTPAGIAAAAIFISNLLVFFTGQRLTPQQRVGVGVGAAAVVFLAGTLAFPAAFADSANTAEILFAALMTVLAAAGAPVIKEAARPPLPAPPPPPQPDNFAGLGDDEPAPRTWTVWSR